MHVEAAQLESMHPQTINVLDHITDSVAVLDHDWRYTYLNHAAEILLGKPKSDLIGQVFWDAPPEVIRSISHPLLHRAMRDRVALRFEEFDVASGRWIETEVFPAADGLILFLRDTSATKQTLEEARWVQNELKRSNEDLRRANRDLETFAYSASHDLQEPLRNIAIFSQLLERKLGQELDEETRQFLEGIHKGTRRMENLVKDVLAYSRAARHAEGPIPQVNAGDALSTVLQNLKTRIEQSNVAVTSGTLPQLSVHSVHLEQLFQNLLSNAIKYRDHKEPPHVHVSARQQEGWWVISVADNGIGIDPEYGAQIFGLFKRLHSRERYPGSGVGLAICQRIVEHYGGRIWLEQSTPGRGSVFSFALPDRRIE
jgi:signal transduction histidine kinase